MTDHEPRPGAKLLLALGAGLLGATLMLVSQKAEMKATEREPSRTPAKAVERLSGVTLYDDRAEARLSTAAHFGFGTTLGLGLVALDRAPTTVRTPLFVAGAWTVGTAVLVALGLAKPPTRWSRGELAADLGHHAVYGLAAASAYAGGRRILSQA